MSRQFLSTSSSALRPMIGAASTTVPHDRCVVGSVYSCKNHMIYSPLPPTHSLCSAPRSICSSMMKLCAVNSKAHIARNLQRKRFREKHLRIIQSIFCLMECKSAVLTRTRANTFNTSDRATSHARVHFCKTRTWFLSNRNCVDWVTI